MAEISLGVETDTLDYTGHVIRQIPVSALHTAAIVEVQSRFTGEIEQIPPLYSNLKVDGRRGHEIARQGQTADLKPRKVIIHENLLAIKDAATLTMRCNVSSGTYIRSLARDIAVALGTCGHLSLLRRTRIGPYHLAEENPPHHVGSITAEMTDFEALAFFGRVTLSGDEAKKLQHGMPLRSNDSPGIYRLVCDEKFLGLGCVEGGQLKSEKVYPN